MVQLLRALPCRGLPHHVNLQYICAYRAKSLLELEYICYPNVLQPPPWSTNLLPRFLRSLFWFNPNWNFPYVQLANNGPTKLSRHEYHTRSDMVMASHRSPPHQNRGRTESDKDRTVWKSPNLDAVLFTNSLTYRHILLDRPLLLWSMALIFWKESRNR